jgi:hypothetical protein
MVQTITHLSQDSLNSRDLELCQSVFDKIRSQHDVVKDSEEAERVTSIIIELYRQGMHNPDELRSMAEAARGLFEVSEA